MYELGEEQKEALNLIREFLHNKEEKAFSLTGSAGTGKSSLINFLCTELEQQDIPYVLCAPTHKASLVVTRFTGRDAITLHQLLSLSPKIDILDFDFNELQFKIGSNQVIPYKGVVICDEASMINDDLFKLLISKCEEYKSKIIFVSDSKQLAPVKNQNLSLVYSLENSYNLSKIYRQSEQNGVLETLQSLRCHSMSIFNDSVGEEGSLYTTQNLGQFLKWACEGFSKAIKNSDILEAKLIAFTNSRVNALNNTIRRGLFKDAAEYHKFEFLTGYENLDFNGMSFYNSMDYIIIEHPKKLDIPIPDFLTLPGYRLELYDSLTKRSAEVDILSKDISKYYFDSLASTIEDIRLSAVQCQNRFTRNKLWKKYYATINSFTTPIDLTFSNRIIRRKTFDYGYAISTHKSQGSTINNIYVDMKNINQCKDEMMLRQLQYVALSRAKSNVYLLQ